MKNRNSRMREIAFHQGDLHLLETALISHTVLYGFYGFDLTNNAKKKHVRK
jgi:hypothetical protein